MSSVKEKVPVSIRAAGSDWKGSVGGTKRCLTFYCGRRFTRSALEHVTGQGLRSRWRLSSCYQLLYHVNEIWRSVDVPAIAFRIPAPFRGVSTQLAAQTSREIPGATCLCRWWVQGLFPGVRSGEYFSDVLFIRVGDSLCLDSGRVMLHGAEGGRAALLAVA